MFVVSPHLDDAVLGIGTLMACRPGSLCATVFAGSPARLPPIRERPHDEACGLGGVRDPVARRRTEDTNAMEAIAWRASHLHFLDAQYLWPMSRPKIEQGEIAGVVEALWSAEGEPSAIWTCAGIAHEDHIVVREAVAQVCRRHDVEMLVWFEPGYRTKFASERDRLAEECNRGLTHYLLSAGEAVAKLRLAECYATQLHGISARALADALTAEVYGIWQR